MKNGRENSQPIFLGKWFRLRARKLMLAEYAHGGAPDIGERTCAERPQRSSPPRPLSAGTLSALAVTSTSVRAAAPGAAGTLPAPSAPVQTINAQPAASSVSVKTYSYGSHSRNDLDVFAPSSVASASSSVRRATVVLVHGGSWVKGDKDNMATPPRRSSARATSRSP